MRREQVVEVLRGALLPLPYVNAAWLGGSDAFGHSDELSDVDLQVDVDDGHVAATFGAVEAALAAASPIRYRMVMPMPTWHGHAQRFYRLRDTAETTAAARWSCSTGPGSSARSRSTRPSWPRPSPASPSGCRSPCPWSPRRSAGATPWPPSAATSGTWWRRW
ncbi:MAG: hypothetical protein ACJ75K_27245 [Actinomycetes bacterium]